MDKPTTLAGIYEQQAYWDTRRKRAEHREAAAKKTVDQCYKHMGVKGMVEQLAELLAPHFPDLVFEVMGPFGLSHETSIYVSDPKTLDERNRFRTVGSLTFRPHTEMRKVGDAWIAEPGQKLRRVDRSRNLGEYPTNSIGAINGFNYPEVDLPGTIEEIADLLRASIKEDAHVD